MTYEYHPSTVGLGLTTAIGLVGAVSTLLTGVWLGLVGVALAGSGVYRGSRGALGVGVLVLFGSVVVAGLLSAPAVALVVAMVGAVLAWDVGENAITVGEQFPETARTWRGELIHAIVSTIVVTVFAIGAFVVYTVSTGGYPLAAVALVVVGALVVLVGLGR
jgi:hypothetical protein